MITAGKTVRRLKSSQANPLDLAELALVRYGGAVAGAPIDISELVEGAGSNQRPSPRLMQDVLGRHDLILVKLSAENFFALRLAEIRHVLRLPATIVVQSFSEYFHENNATPFFQAFMKLDGSNLEETVRGTCDQIDQFSTTYLPPNEVYASIDHYLEHASCFRWGQANMRHGPPNRFSLEQYRSGVDPEELQRLYHSCIGRCSRLAV